MFTVIDIGSTVGWNLSGYYPYVETTMGVVCTSWGSFVVARVSLQYLKQSVILASFRDMKHSRPLGGTGHSYVHFLFCSIVDVYNVK